MLLLENAITLANLLLPSVTHDLEKREMGHGQWQLLLRPKPGRKDPESPCPIVIRKQSNDSISMECPTEQEEVKTYFLADPESMWDFVQVALHSVAQREVIVGKGRELLSDTIHTLTEIPITERTTVLAAFFYFAEVSRKSAWTLRLVRDNDPATGWMHLVYISSLTERCVPTVIASVRYRDNVYELKAGEEVSTTSNVKCLSRLVFASDHVRDLLDSTGMTQDLQRVQQEETQDWSNVAERLRALLSSAEEQPIRFEFLGEGSRLTVQLVAGDRRIVLFQAVTRQQELTPITVVWFKINEIEFELPNTYGHNGLILIGILISLLTRDRQVLADQLDVEIELLERLLDWPGLLVLVDPPPGRFLLNWALCYYIHWVRRNQGMPTLQTFVSAGDIWASLTTYQLTLHTSQPEPEFLRHLRTLWFREVNRQMYAANYEVQFQISGEMPHRLTQPIGRSAEFIARQIDAMMLQITTELQHLAAYATPPDPAAV